LGVFGDASKVLILIASPWKNRVDALSGCFPDGWVGTLDGYPIHLIVFGTRHLLIIECVGFYSLICSLLYTSR
jgi:hypothetical protein